MILRAALPLGVALLVLLPGGLSQFAPASPAGTTHGGPTASGLAGARPVLESSSNLTCQARGLLGQPCATAAPGPSVRPSSGSVNPKTWTGLTSSVGTAPSARYLGAMVYDPIDGYVLLFGGYGPSGLLSDTWTYAHGHWTELSTSGPSGRYVAAIAWDAADGYAVLFGGYSGNTVIPAYNDTWTFVHGVWSNITGTTNQTPTGRWRAVMAYDSGDGYVLLYGGTNGAETVAYSDTWEFLHGNWTKLNVSGSPPARFRASMVDDPLDNYTVVFGGCTSIACSSADSTTWVYHNLTWKALAPSSHPSARVYYGLTYSTISNTVLLYGGSTDPTASTGAQADTWNFTGGNWSSLTGSLTHSPPALSYVMMAFDPLDGYTLMFGGEFTNATFTNETWALGPSILGQVSVAPGAIDLGQTAQINATPVGHPGYVVYNYTTLPPGCSSSNVSVLNCTPNAVGTFPIAATLNDSSGVPVNVTGSLTVNADPAIASFVSTLTNVTVGSRLAFEANASGGTGGLSYRYSGLPTGCSSANLAVLNCTPTAAGSDLVKVTVTDGVRVAVNATTAITVNAQPNVTNLVPLPSTLDVDETLKVTATVAGGTAPLTYAWSELPAGCTSVDAPVLTCSPTAAYDGLVTVNATDSFGWSTHDSVLVIVAPDPSFTSGVASPAVIDVGTPVHIWANATGGTGALSYLYTNEPAGCSLGNDAANSCMPTVGGNFTVEAEVQDETGYAAFENISFSVNAPMAAPTVAASPTTIDLGQNVTFTATPSGGTGPYTYSFTDLPSGCSSPASVNQDYVVCVPRSSGTYSVTIAAKDSLGVTQSSAGSVKVNPDPVIGSFGPASNPTTVGTSVDLVTNATQGSGVFTYKYTGLPAGCSTSNTSSLTCTPTATGSFIVTVTARDTLGESATAQAYLNVTAKSSTSVLGLPATTFDLLLVALIVLVAIVAAVVVMRRRKNAPPPAAAAPEEWTEEPET
jgi:hypothetical protein